MVVVPPWKKRFIVRDWRRKSEGIEASRISIDLSLFCLNTMENLPSQLDFCLQFWEDGYVKRLFASVTSAGLPSSPTVSALRVSHHPAARNFQREVFTLTQCAGHEGPRMPPDVVVGHDLGAWTNADRAQEYNCRLVNSNSTRVGARSLILRKAHLLTS